MPKRRASQPDDDGDDDGADDDALDPDLPPEPPPLDPPFEWTIDGVTRTFTRASALSRSLGKQPGSGDELERAMAAFHARDRTPERQAMRDARNKYLTARRQLRRSSSRTERRHSTEGGLDAHRRASHPRIFPRGAFATRAHPAMCPA